MRLNAVVSRSVLALVLGAGPCSPVSSEQTGGRLLDEPLSQTSDDRSRMPPAAPEQGKRLIRSTCLDFSVEDPWARPVENLTAVVDLDAHKVIEIIDTGIVPMSTSDGTA